MVFEIPGVPKGKGRARFAVMGGYVKTYTPKDTADYEDYIRECYLLQGGQIKTEEAIRVEIIGYFPVPKSVSKKTRQEMLSGRIPYTKKVDCDNLAKVVLDALNRVAYDDDKQVVDLRVKKEYSENPKVLVKIERWRSERA